MADAADRVAQGLSKAMQAEQEGRHFYLMAAQSTQDPKGRQVFERLAEEELGHFNYLKTQYRSVKQTGRVDTSVQLGSRLDLSGGHPIFSEEIKNRIGQAHYEMTALSIGIQLELSAVKFYTGEAEAASDPVVKSFYKELAEWEQGHLDAFRAQADSLKEDYWSEGGFSPF
jgi:rubrerythrin